MPLDIYKLLLALALRCPSLALAQALSHISYRLPEHSDGVISRNSRFSPLIRAF